MLEKQDKRSRPSPHQIPVHSKVITYLGTAYVGYIVEGKRGVVAAVVFRMDRVGQGKGA